MADTWKDQRRNNNGGKSRKSGGRRDHRRYDEERSGWKNQRRVSDRANRRNGSFSNED